MTGPPAKTLPEAKFLRACVSYSPKTGLLHWKRRPKTHFVDSHAWANWNNQHAGKQAFGGRLNRGYLRGKIDGVSYLAHRIIWKIQTDAEPKFIDHINGDRSDNRWINLRDVTAAENGRNRLIKPDSKNPYPGVRKDKRGWSVTIGRTKHVGTFYSEGEAIEARKAAEADLGYISRSKNG